MPPISFQEIDDELGRIARSMDRLADRIIQRLPVDNDGIRIEEEYLNQTDAELSRIADNLSDNDFIDAWERWVFSQSRGLMKAGKR